MGPFGYSNNQKVGIFITRQLYNFGRKNSDCESKRHRIGTVCPGILNRFCIACLTPIPTPIPTLRPPWPPARATGFFFPIELGEITMRMSAYHSATQSVGGWLCLCKYGVGMASKVCRVKPGLAECGGAKIEIGK